MRRQLEKISLKGKIYALMCITMLFSFDFLFLLKIRVLKIFFLGLIDHLIGILCVNCYG